ncbi:hypothetical protein CEE45_02020 [Candidatus Heimdallarchaeota archaeon B3_Heim]|nr:MAG: hypothetical protein CEE45_02020 [Candidatus Heimdallarchaeota archaeon B3_Heim]
MKLNLQQILLYLFLSVLTIEYLGVLSWWLIDIDSDIAFVFIFEFVLIFFGTLAFITFKRKRGTPQTDERIEKFNERSIMVGGIAGLLMLLQVTVVEIITGLNFRAIDILFIVGMTFFATIAAANFVQTRFG